MRQLYLVLLLSIFFCQTNAQSLIISEFRLNGPNGVSDEYVEIYNNSDNQITVATTDNSSGFALVASNGVTRFVIPNGTVIPPRGHFLGVNAVGYSLASYPAGNGTTATGDASYTTEIPLNAGIALFKTSNSANFNLANRLDAVGSTSETNSLYKEGAGYPPINLWPIDCCFHRKEYSGFMIDGNNNATDYKFEDTNGTNAGAGQSLGAPGPQNLSSPIAITGIVMTVINPSEQLSSSPNFARDITSDPANNATFGRLNFRYKITNNSGRTITRLRFRIDSINAFPSLEGIADLRPLTSSDVVVSSPSTGTVTVRGTTLEEPASQPNGGGFNSSFSVPAVSTATPLANGASVYVNLTYGVQQDGNFRIALTPEANVTGTIVTSANTLKAFISKASYGAAANTYFDFASATLPLLFTSLTAKENRSGVLISWKTSEQNISTYYVHRSNDGSTFQQIGTVYSLGNGNQNYLFTDAQPLKGLNQYRITAVENGNKKYTSAIASVHVKNSMNDFTVFSKGNTLEVRLNSTDRTSYEMEITNAAGQAVYKTRLVQNGSSAHTFHLPGGLSKGVYTLVLKNSQSIISKTFLLN